MPILFYLCILPYMYKIKLPVKSNKPVCVHLHSCDQAAFDVQLSVCLSRLQCLPYQCQSVSAQFNHH